MKDSDKKKKEPKDVKYRPSTPPVSVFNMEHNQFIRILRRIKKLEKKQSGL